MAERVECCKVEYPPVDCFADGVCKEYTYLVNRNRQQQPTRRRIKTLAIPKFTTPKFRPSCPCNSSRRTEIIRDKPYMTRTEQLSYPSFRRLLPLQREYAKVFDEERMCILNRTMRKSVLSLYSRLANVQAPKERKKITGWSKKDWAIHKKYLKQLAKPKKIFYPQKPIHMWKDIALMKLFKKLCLPKMRKVDEKPQWELTPAVKTYTASERILFLARAKEADETIHYQPLPIEIKPEALTYKATELIKQLATPPQVRLGESDLKENPFGISPNALKGKASDRVLELAKPKEYSDTHTREHPFLISPAALKAKATPRIIELAKAKTYD